MSRRTRTQVFEELVSKIKERKFIGRGELSTETATNPDLYKKCIDAMERVGMIKKSYVFSPSGSGSGRQREMLEAVNLDNSELYIKALAEVLSPSLSELFHEWYYRKHPIAEPHMTTEELEKEASAKRTFNLVRRSFGSERVREEV